MRKRLISWFTFAVPFFVALSLCGAAPGWLDSGEFVAASASLGLSHPPGHPAYLLLTHGFSFLPLGSIAFRMALFSALCLGLASWLTFRITLYLMAFLHKENSPFWKAFSWTELVIAATVTIAIALSYTCMLQAVRAEVYTLHAALILASLERLLSAYCQHKGIHCTVENAPDASAQQHPSSSASCDSEVRSELTFPEKRDLFLSSLWAGIALANHHYLTLLMLPGILALLLAWGWRSFWRSWIWIGMIMLMGGGLLSYTYLPLRSVSQPTIHWGEAHSLRGWFWYVSAKAWQSSVRPLHQTQTPTQRLMLLSSVFAEQLGWLWFFLLLFGCYLLVRLGGMVGLSVLLWWSMGLLGRWVFVVDRMDADLHGYLVVSMFFSGCILAVVMLWLWGRVQYLQEYLQDKLTRFLWLPSLVRGIGTLAILWLLLVPWMRLSEAALSPEQYPFSLVHCDRSQSWGSLVWIELMEEPLPLGAVLLSSHYQTGFLRWYREVVERHRPDLQNFPRNLMGHKGYTELAAKQKPAFQHALQAFLHHLPERIQAFRDSSPTSTLCLEWFDDLSPDLASQLSPSGSFFCWLPANTTRSPTKDKRTETELESWREQQHFFWQRVYRQLQPHREHDQDLRNVLLWTHYQHARFYEKTKRWKLAIDEVDRALRLFPYNHTLVAMKQRLRQQLN